MEKSRKKWCFEASATSAEDPWVCIDHDFRILLDEEGDPKVRTSFWLGNFFRIQDTHPVNKGTIAGILLRPLLRETMGVNLTPQEPERNNFIYLRGFGIGEVYKLPL